MAPEKTEKPVENVSLEKRLADLEAQVRGLVPLHELVPHITQIKRTFGAG